MMLSSSVRMCVNVCLRVVSLSERILRLLRQKSVYTTAL